MPVEISDVELAFPAHALDFMPAMEDIPEEFGSFSNPWAKFVSTWFAFGLGRFSFIPTEGVDPNMAFRQLSAIMGSYQPQHEHKTAAVAYLSSVWMESLVYGRPNIPDEDLTVVGKATLDEWLKYFEELEAGHE